MANRTVRRVVVAIASTAVAAAGLLATGGSASAATYPSSSHAGAVSAVRTPDSHSWDQHNRSEDRHGRSGDRHSAFGGWGDDGHGHWNRDHDGRGYWKQDHDGGRYWIRYDDRDGYRAQIDEGRRQWVLDQLRWADGHEYTNWGLEHHDRSHR
ncbi:hypothetical protein [Streptomyces sp. NBC_01618]|uniref:hypothetical protein n=1 Tax=Streptomyces sp. NBC_01618 TaxID=2975900 RepID=UPI00386D5E4A|nr:hypothetical protein OH735_36925 [Streptomyces sp. NBC_01618]